MITLKTNGKEIYKVTSPGTSGLNVNDIINSTGISANNSFTMLKVERQSDFGLSGLSVSGNWTNTQYISSAVDTTGLTFTASYTDGSSKTVTPTSMSPTTWSSTVGTQTCTFTYTEDGVSKTCEKSASIADKLEGLSVSGDWSNTQYAGRTVDPTGLTFTATMLSGATKTVTPTSMSPSTWSSTVGTQTCTFTYTENGVSKSCTKDASVQEVDPKTLPLAFTANTAGSTVTLGKYGSPSWTGYYSTDGGSTWTAYTPGTTGAITLTNIGDSVCFKGTYSTNPAWNSYLKFSMSGSIAASGNIMSMCSGDNYASVTTIPYSYCFYYLFSGCSSLTTAPVLPATTLTEGCYYSMFYGCTSLTTAPALPATTLAQSCYYNMFSGCKSLTTAPALPATTLTEGCYYSMFYGCTGLTTAPALNATTLAESCCSSMFVYCTSLTTAPALPATTLAERCYYDMFSGCKSLTTAPALPATTLASECYNSMFSGCTGLTTAPALPATTLAENCYQYMFSGCKSLTTAPTLNATTLANRCYYGMFSGCTGLTTAPALNATTLAERCYYDMFQGCTSLTTVPTALPATTLAQSCYGEMFRDCTKLTSAPALPATTLTGYCYSDMFWNCTSLTSAPALPATTLAQSCYYEMFRGCTSLTTVPALPATTLASWCYGYMFKDCTALYVSDTSGSGYNKAWRIPKSGTFSNTYEQNNMFTSCLGTRSSDTMAGAAGRSYTYYTQNTPV